MRRRSSLPALVLAFWTWPVAVHAEQPGVPYASWTASPLPLDAAALDPVAQDVLARCGAGEEGLREVAVGIVGPTLKGAPLPELDGLARAQRAAGEPHPWPRAWAARGRRIDSAAVQASLDAWLGTDASAGRRCGVATGQAPDGTRALVVITVEALADLAPLPTRARTGQWLTLDARLRSRSTSTSVVVLEGNAPPRTVPSWVDGSRVRARFAAQGPGELDLQVVANLASGPRPVLEATVFVDRDPAVDAVAGPAPGEDAADPTPSPDTSSDADRISRMMAAARATAGLAGLPRDGCLDRVALAHAEQMARRHELGHDVGDGDPLERLRVAGLDPHAVAENVAHAPTLPLAHRALWASPSHRMNLLGRVYDRSGVGVVRDDRGDAWVVELFTGGSATALARCAGL